MLPVYCLQLPGLIIKKLLDAGFMFAEDVVLSNNEFHAEAERLLNFDPELKAVITDSLKKPTSNSAAALIQSKPKRILTFSYRLDKLLGGGVPLGSLLEVCGAPGSGKTQLCLQLCISIQLHSRLAGLQAEALYIDTDAGFSPHRLQEIGKGCREHCCKVAKVNKFSPDVVKFLETQAFKEYYYISVLDHTQLIATVLTLDEFIRKNNKAYGCSQFARTVVVITFHPNILKLVCMKHNQENILQNITGRLITAQ